MRTCRLAHAAGSAPRERWGASLARLALAALVALLLVGCGPSEAERAAAAEEQRMAQEAADEDVVAQGVRQAMDAFVADVAGGNDEFVRRLFRDLSFEVRSVSVDGDTATATLAITCIDAEQAAERAAEELEGEQGVQDLSELYGSAEESRPVELASAIGEVLYRHLDATTDMITSEITLSLAKRDGSWSVDEASLDALVEAVCAGMALR